MWPARHHPKKYRHNLALVPVVHHRAVEMLDLVAPLQRAAMALAAPQWVKVDSPLKVDRTWHLKAKLRWVKALDQMHHLKVKVRDLTCRHRVKALGLMHHHPEKVQAPMHHLKVKRPARTHHQVKKAQKVKVKAKVQTTHLLPTMSLKVVHLKAA